MASSSGIKREVPVGRAPSRKMTRMPTMIDMAEDEVNLYVPSSLAPIAPILRVANDIQDENPRVAYLCRFHALEQTQKLDPSSSGRGVRQFKTYLLHRLEKEEIDTKPRLAGSNAEEIQLFYQWYYDQYVKDPSRKKPEEMAKHYQIASVLYDVMKALIPIEKVDKKIFKFAEEVARKKVQYAPYNILPLHVSGDVPVIMQLPEIQAAVNALRDIDNLPKLRIQSTEDIQQKVDGSSIPGNNGAVIRDLLDWLGAVFGFQKGNVENQREHLIFLLANIDSRSRKDEEYSLLASGTVINLMEKVFMNYRSWCHYLHIQHNLKFPNDAATQRVELLYIGLYFLIWGEASNIRFMPECLCYIFHHMAGQLYEILGANVQAATGDYYYELAHHDGEKFLRDVVTPIYQVMRKEAQRNKGGAASHSKWRNYDDLNEYFWSKECLKIDWPMKLDNDFFVHTKETHSKIQHRDQVVVGRRKPKTNFVEVRTFWHLYRSFDRMWIFFILAFQAMLIIAWSPLGSITAIFDPDVFRSVLSIFITAALLNFLQATLDIVLSLKAWGSLRPSQIIRYLLKFAVAAAWLVVLPIGYSSSVQNPTGLVKYFSNWARNWQSQSFYSFAIAIYVIPNILAALLFMLPLLRRFMERSNYRIIVLLMWWAQPKLYVGRGMHESTYSLFKYTLFWIVLLICKLAFSYYVEISPLIEPTKRIMDLGVGSYEWHEFFPNLKHNIGVVITIWAPIVLVYFMDTQIWYAIFSTIVGGIRGAFSHLGEIRTLGMLRSRFESVPSAFSDRLVPSSKKNQDIDGEREKLNIANFSHVWNAFIKSLREEDLISNKERDLLLVPYSSDGNEITVVQWPPFLLASKIPIALDMAKDFKGKDDRGLFNKIKYDDYMWSAVIECYETLRDILYGLLVDPEGKEFLRQICKKVDTSIANSKFLSDFRTSELPQLNNKLEKLLTLLKDMPDPHREKPVTHSDKPDPPDSQDADLYKTQIINVVQDMMEIIAQDIMIHAEEITARWNAAPSKTRKERKFGMFDVNLDLLKNESWKEKVVRLHLLLTIKESAINVPMNLDARRRITFFANSLFMKLPPAPHVRKMLSFSVLTPYFKEDVLYSDEELNMENEDGISTLFYLQKIYPDEWKNYEERRAEERKAEERRAEERKAEERKAEERRAEERKAEERRAEKRKAEERGAEERGAEERGAGDTQNNHMASVREWVSYRGQTLSRTVRGMMYYRRALELQGFLDVAQNQDILGGRGSLSPEKTYHDQLSAATHAHAVADLKFTYVVSCQVYGMQKKSSELRDRSCYQNILNLMLMYPSLRVAYIDEREETIGGKQEKVYYSVLIKGGEKWDEEIYRIKLPGPPTAIGEGKPENQNHAIIFTRGEALQTIDMNQDNYLEEAFKIRNVLQEFLSSHHGRSKPTILGLREHIFTGSVSSLAWFMSNQETSFVTIGQRILADPLKVRFHYGHPDIFDRIFHITRGGISKASKTINLSEDIFSGFNSTLRGGNVTHHEYMQVGKGRDVGMNQISLFEAKVANGNGEQTLSRDVYRLGRRFDFYRMLSFYFTTVGFYFSSMVTVLTVYVFLYGRLYLVMSGLERSILEDPSMQQNKSLENALASQSVFQLGFLLVLPMVMEVGLEKGFRTALGEFIIMQLQLAPVFFTFQLGTKVHYYGRTILHGGSKYRATGRGFVVFHAKFADNYRLYSRSHFVKGLEMMILLIVYQVYGQSYRSSNVYLFVTFSMWFLVVSWLFAPFIFNPSGFEWQKTVDDWTDWKRWMGNRGGIGIAVDRSWESWWQAEHDHLKNTSIRGRILEILLALRFLIYQYGIVYHLNIAHHSKSVLVYGLSWFVMLTVLLVLKMVSVGRRRFGTDFQLMFRILKGLLFLGFVSVMTVLFVVCGLTIVDVFASILGFMPTGWSLLLIGQACIPLMKGIGFWDSIKELGRAYEYVMGLIIFMPIVVLSWFPFVSEFQTRLLFNQAFSRGLQISRILAGKKDSGTAAN